MIGQTTANYSCKNFYSFKFTKSDCIISKKNRKLSDLSANSANIYISIQQPCLQERFEIIQYYYLPLLSN